MNQNLPAEQAEGSNTPETKEENGDMNLKKVRRNVLQVIGDGARALGDKAADFKANHPVGDTAIKVVGTVAIVGGAVGLAAAKILGGKDEEIVDATDDSEVMDLDDEIVDEDLDAEDDDVEVNDDTEESATEEVEA